MSSNPVHGLVIEENPQFTSQLLAIIGAAGAGQFKLTAVEGLSKALDSIRRGSYEVILLDPTLTGYSGLDALLQLAAYVPDLPVVLLTRQDDRALAIQAIREGAQDCLVLKEGLEPELLARSLLYAVERQRVHVMLKHISLIDDLTGLLNRRGFLSLAQQTMKIAHRADWELTLLFADLDGLKNINDRFGHPEGDRALRTVATILRATFRSSDLIARLGGDEFIVLAIDASAAGMEAIRARLHENIARYNALNSRYKLALSYGVAMHGKEKKISLEELIARADEDLYAQKHKKQRD